MVAEVIRADDDHTKSNDDFAGIADLIAAAPDLLAERDRLASNLRDARAEIDGQQRRSDGIEHDLSLMETALRAAEARISELEAERNGLYGEESYKMLRAQHELACEGLQVAKTREAEAVALLAENPVMCRGFPNPRWRYRGDSGPCVTADCWPCRAFAVASRPTAPAAEPVPAPRAISRFHLFALLHDQSKTLSERGDAIWNVLHPPAPSTHDTSRPGEPSETTKEPAK
ncbi:MAG TPA: hypothetical protein VHG72_21650 [Polyangia bacterium]|nr:hypothetical protein [Polyangia bacterium]